MKKTKKVAKKDNDIMDTESCCSHNCKKGSGCGGFAYFLGAIGSAIYYVSTSTSFWGGVLGILKSLVWPAFLVYEIMKYIGL